MFLIIYYILHALFENLNSVFNLGRLKNIFTINMFIYLVSKENFNVVM